MMQARGPGRLGRGLLAAAVLATLALPAPASASTGPETPPPPCAVAPSLEAGVPLTLSGTRSTDEPVGVMMRRSDGEFREAAAVTVERTWRAILLFGAADGGTWTLEINVDGVSCVSPLVVTLPAGVVAPPTSAPVAEEMAEAPGEGIDPATIRDAAILSGVILVILSWVFLVVLALARAFGRQVMGRRVVRALARISIFVAILGVGVAAWAVVDIVVSIQHFSSGIPPDQRVALDLALWAVIVLGSVLGTVAARLVRNTDLAGDRE